MFLFFFLFLFFFYFFFLYYIIKLFFLFFFSSRRRHTRFSRDWSSDVCSSDLTGTPCLRTPHCPRRTGPRTRGSAGGDRPRRTRTAACRAPPRAPRARPRPRGRAAPALGREAPSGRSLLRVLVETGHLVRGGDAEQPERVGEPDPARFGQPEPGLRERGVVADHAAVSIEAVEVLGELAYPSRDPVRGAQVGRLAHGLRKHREGAQQLRLPLVRQRREVDVRERESRDAPV